MKVSDACGKSGLSIRRRSCVPRILAAVLGFPPRKGRRANLRVVDAPSCNETAPSDGFSTVGADARHRSAETVTARWYAAAVLLAAAAASLVLWQLGTSPSTHCFRKSVDLSAGGRTPKDEPQRTAKRSLVTAGCNDEVADAVARALARHGIAADRSSPLEARSALVVWLALLAATAGFAAFSGVRSATIIAGLRPVWDRRLVVFSVAAVVLVALPFAMFLALARYKALRFGSFDVLHQHEFHWLDPTIGALAMPAVIGLVVVGRIVSTQPSMGLRGLAGLGSDMRQLVAMVGTILSLAVLTTAARWQAIGTLPGGEALPGTVDLLWGGTFAVALAVLYFPVYRVWAEATEREIAKEVERQILPDRVPGGTRGFRAPELALTKELAATLGLGGALRLLQGSVAVLAPVIAAAVSSLFA
jgi:hypothetical protein